MELDEEIPFYDQVELVKSICILVDRLNARDGSEAVVIVKA